MVLRMNNFTKHYSISKRWQMLHTKQKEIIFALLFILLFLAVFFLFLTPSYQGYKDSKKRFEAELQLHAWFKEISPKLSAIANARIERGATSQTVLSTVAQLAKEFSISIERAQPKDLGVVIWVKGVNFNQLVGLLYALEGRKGMVAIEVQLSGADDSGLCSGQIVIKNNAEK